MKGKSERKAALYARVSTDAQRDEGYSIDAQKEMLSAYCVSKQIVSWEYYVDGGFSGSNVERPEMQRLIADVRSGLISCVVVYKLDRLSRSQKDTLFLIEDVFNPNNTGFVSLNENMDTSTPIGRAMLGIMSAFAQLERETIRERTRIGMNERVKSGYWMGGGKIPFGYDYDRDRGILIPNDDAERVRKIYELYLRGWSFQRISKALGLAHEHHAEQIMLRRTNLGVIPYRGGEYKGLHQPIIDSETYDRALELYEKRSRKSLTTAKSLLAGLLICGVCGHKMRYQKWGQSGYKIYCYSQDKGKAHIGGDNPCANFKVWADDIETLVVGDLFEFAGRITSGEKLTSDADAETELNALKRKIAAAEKRIKSLYNLYADGNDEMLIEVIKENKTELERLQGLAESEKRTEEELDKRLDTAHDIVNLRDAWQYMQVSEKQAILRQVIDKIVITYDKVEVFYSL